MNEKQMKILGWVATFMSVMMYVSYFPQIMDNLAGHKGNFIQPLVAAINCSLWVYYGLFKKERDIPLAAANAPGIIFGLITAITALQLIKKAGQKSCFFFYDFTHFHGIMGGLFIEKIKRRHEWIKNVTAKSYGRKINTWC